jgi:hypothetical protein
LKTERHYSKALQGPPEPTPLAISVTRGLVWWYCLGEGDAPDFILFRDKDTPIRLDVPHHAGWPRTRQEAMALGLRVLQAGYLRPRPLFGVTITPQYDERAMYVPHLEGSHV